MTEEDDIDGLAAEYVLGSLDPAERKEVDARRRTDGVLDAAIVAWQRRVGPLSEQVPEIEPPVHLRNAILARIASIGSGAATPARIIELPRRPTRRRSIAVWGGALAACLVLGIGLFNFLHIDRQGGATHARMDCGKLYKDFWEQFSRENAAKISADQLAGVSRMALRAHDACQAGDEQDARSLFQKLQRMQL